MNLKGNSGCRVELINGIIHKSGKDRDRLFRQICKQDEFWWRQNLWHDNVLTPEVFRKYFYYPFRMQWIDGNCILDWIAGASYDELRWYSDIITDWIIENIGAPQDIHQARFITKYSIIKELVGISLPPSWDDFVERESQNVTVPSGYSHNDLTLSNMLHKDRKVYLVDFSTSFLPDTPMSDMSKLRQESFHKLKLDGGTYTGVQRDRLNLLDNLLYTSFSRFGWYNKYWRLWGFFDLARCLPYAQSEDVRFSIVAKIQSLVELDSGG
jgi:hypothetical protein